MPYIIQDRRRELEAALMDGIPRMDRPGDLEYLVTLFILEYLTTKGLRHQTIAEIRGVLVGALAEFNRRVAFPYEDQKITDNGDVY